MNYETASQYITAEFIYADVTAEEAEAVAQNKYITEVQGVLLLGVNEAVESLADRLLIKPEPAPEPAPEDVIEGTVV